MDHAIESLREHIRAAVSILEEMPDDDKLKSDIKAMVRAVNVLEKYEYGQHITKFNEIIGRN